MESFHCLAVISKALTFYGLNGVRVALVERKLAKLLKSSFLFEQFPVRKKIIGRSTQIYPNKNK